VDIQQATSLMVLIAQMGLVAEIIKTLLIMFQQAKFLINKL